METTLEMVVKHYKWIQYKKLSTESRISLLEKEFALVRSTKKLQSKKEVVMEIETHKSFLEQISKYEAEYASKLWELARSFKNTTICFFIDYIVHRQTDAFLIRRYHLKKERVIKIKAYMDELVKKTIVL